MKIHQIAPPYIPVHPAISYGGIERVMYQLDKRLTSMGHETSMSAPLGSRPVGKLYETIMPVGFGEDKRFSEIDSFFLKLDHIAMSINTANRENFDIVHVHEENQLPFFRFVKKPVIHTIHSIPEEFWKPQLHPGITEAKNLVAVSKKVMDIYSDMGFDVRYVVHNGFDIDYKYFCPEKLDYLLALSIIRPEKGFETAIDVAENLEMSLVLAGNIGDTDYFNKIKPRITHSIEDAEDKLHAYKQLPRGRKVIYAGRVDDRQKYPLFAHAKTFLVPSIIEDSLPGVVIEAMACGTPVIGFNRGGIPEMIHHCYTGYIVENVDEMTDAVKKADDIDPSVCRNHYESYFTSDVMAKNYLDVYREVCRNG
ncbi:MAG: glycosyltransferase [Candidatus Aenigmatarchaeota archaeon]